MTSPYNYVVRRDDLQALTRNPRLVRYFEGLQKAIGDVTTLSGEDDPETLVKANASRMYINTTTGKLWINTAVEYGSLTGWVLAN